MKKDPTDGLALYRFDSFPTDDGVSHAITSRHGGISTGPFASLNLSWGAGDDEAAVSENVRRAASALGFRPEHVTRLNQKHTANVMQVHAAGRGQVFDYYDALITDVPGIPLLVRCADCAPILLYDPVQRAIGAIHSGWRGTVQRVGPAAVEAMGRAFGSRPADMIAGIGPCIGPCCYEVGDEVIEAVHGAFDRPSALLSAGPARASHFDLWAANRQALSEAGVLHIEVAGICTACHRADFFSYRAQRGVTGHFGAFIALRGVE